jgi:hypothetical protein
MTLDPEIADFYERSPEESRLETGRSQLEGARTRELIERHAPPPPADVIDVGGAAGAYALWLSELGYRVHPPARRRACRPRLGGPGADAVECAGHGGRPHERSHESEQGALGEG